MSGHKSLPSSTRPARSEGRHAVIGDALSVGIPGVTELIREAGFAGVTLACAGRLYQCSQDPYVIVTIVLHRCPDRASNFATAEEAQDEQHMVKIPDLTIEDAKIWHTRLIGFTVARDRKVAKAVVREDSAVVRQALYNKTLYDRLVAL